MCLQRCEPQARVVGNEPSNRGQVKLDLVGHCEDFGLGLLHRVKWEPLEGFEQTIGMI